MKHWHLMTICAAFALNTPAEAGSATPSKTQHVQEQEQVRLVRTLEDQLNTYLEAILSRNASLALDVLSTERKTRLLPDNTSENFEQRVNRFLDQEYGKLSLLVDSVDSFDGIQIETIDRSEEGVILASVSYHAHMLSKPVYFVLEGNDWLLNLSVPNDIGFSESAKSVIAGCDTGNYTVRNDKSVSYYFYYQQCSGDTWKWTKMTLPSYAVVGFNAVDTCSTGWDATQFKFVTNGATKYIKCDYQSFSDDAYVSGSSSSTYGLACYDPC